MKSLNIRHKSISYILDGLPGVKPLKIHAMLRILQLEQEKHNRKSLNLEFNLKGVNWYSEEVDNILKEMREAKLIGTNFLSDSTLTYHLITPLPHPTLEDRKVITHMISGCGLHKCFWKTLRRVEKIAESPKSILS